MSGGCLGKLRVPLPPGLRPLLLPLALLCESELLFNVNLQIRLRDLGEGNADAPRGLVFKQNVVAFDALDAPAEVALTAYGAAGLELGQSPGEPLKIFAAVKTALQPRRGDFEGVGDGDEVVYVEHGADVGAHLGAVFVGDAARLVDEDANDGRARTASEFNVDELEAALGGRTLRYLAHTRFDRSLPVQSPWRTPFQKPSEQKKKWAENPLATPPRSEQEANYTGSPRAWQPGRR